MKPELIYDLLNRALEEEMGLVITTNNPHQMTLRLHEATKGLDKYKDLIISIPSTPDTVIITKKTVELDTPEEGDLP